MVEDTPGILTGSGWPLPGPVLIIINLGDRYVKVGETSFLFLNFSKRRGEGRERDM